jgi:hypothetical protein
MGQGQMRTGTLCKLGEFNRSSFAANARAESVLVHCAERQRPNRNTMKTNPNTNQSWHAPSHPLIANSPASKPRMPVGPDRQPGDCRRRLVHGKASSHIAIGAAVFALGAQVASATIISLDSGGSGSFLAGQSYNETRAADVTVLSPLNLAVTSMTLSGINGSGTAKAVIYDSNTQALLASAQGTLTGGTITLSISATLVSGDEYRIGFYGLLGSGTEFVPSFPYTESSGLLRINNSWSIATDSFPVNSNLDVPEISLQVTQVPEPAGLILLGAGLLSALAVRRRWAR